MIVRFLIFLHSALVLIALTAPSAVASEPVILAPQNEKLVDIEDDMLYFIDDSRFLNLDDVVNLSDDFQPLQTPYIDFGLGDFRVWLKTSLYNSGEATAIWRLDTGRPFMEELDIYLVSPSLGVQPVLRHEDTDKFNQRPIHNRTLTVDLNLPPNEIIDLYISFRSSSTTSLAIDFGQPVTVAVEKSRETIVDMALNGALLAMLLLAVILIPITGWRLSLAFAAYILCGMLYVAHADGYTAQYIWPGMRISNDAFNLIFILLMSASGINFARMLFDFRKTWTGYNRFLIGFIAIALSFAALAYPFIDIVWLMVLAYAIVPLGTLIQPFTGLLAYRRGLLGAGPYLAGASLVLISIVYAVIAHIFPGHYDLDHTLDVGHFVLLSETFAFAGAIVVRLLGIQRERDAALNAKLVAVKDKLALSSALRLSQKQYAEARAISRQRRVQLSSVSHDLQQPLASLRNAITTIALTNDDAGNEMHSALDYLENLARDQIRTDDTQPRKTQSDGNIEVFPVSIVLKNVHEMFKSEARDNDLDFRLRAIDELVQADAVSLMRVVSNLVKNAIRHTHKGSILLAARRRQKYIWIELYDTGQGMSEQELARVMRRWEKDKNSEGTGLGLSIVQDICAQNAWAFTMNSVETRGTRARIAVPRP